MDIGRDLSSYQGYPLPIFTPPTPIQQFSDPKSNCKKGSENGLEKSTLIGRNLGYWEGGNLGSEGGVSEMNAGVYDSFLMDNMWSGVPCSELLALADAAVTGKGSRGANGGGGGISYNPDSKHKFDEQPDRTKFLFGLNSPPILPEPELISTISSQLTPVTPKQPKRTGRERMVSDLINSNKDKITEQNATNLEHSHDDFEEDEDFEDESSDDLNLKKTPQPKQRRRKHRPKVVIEGQTKSSKKSTPVKPNGSSTGKRKYVRKIATDNKSTETPINESTTIRQSTRSCRRKITFDEEWDFDGFGFENEKEFELIYGNQTLNPKTPSKIDTNKNTCSRERDLNFSKIIHNDDCLEVHLSMVTNFPPIYKKKRTEKCYNSITSRTKSSLTWSAETSSLFGNLEGFRKKRSSGIKRVRDLGSLAGVIEGKRRTCLEELEADLSFNIERRKRTNRNYIVSSLSYHNHGFLNNYIGFHSSLRWKTTYDINALTNQFQNLGINNHVVEKDQKALVQYLTRYRQKNGIVLYRQNRSVVPYEVIESYNPLKTRPKVDIDDETSRVWRLLLEDINSHGIDGTNEDNSKWWEEERSVFSGRATSFIARMHLVQGDRRFSKWKGSVVDSVIGVFLTQNVSDHLSSSAFINLAAKYPLKSTSSNEQVNEEKWSISVNESCKLDHNSYEEKDVVKSNKLENIIYSHELNEGISEEKCASEESRISAGHEITEDSKIVVTEENNNNNNNNEYSNCNIEKGVDIENSSADVSEVINIVDNSDSKFNENDVKKGKNKRGKKIKADWDSLRKDAQMKKKRERTGKSMDSLDYEAVRCADVDEISDTIKDRGMNNMLAERIKEFLNRLVKDHGSIDLEWLRDVPPDKAKEYLLSFRGLGLKSVECVRLLTLHHLAFPVDTNVGRIAVRLGWVPLQPLPESLQLHLLELYPILESIQKYLWPRLCKLDQRTLYELHYQMITFGKVFCTKNKPNCNSCPMRGECRHFASAFASSRLSLPAPEEKSIVTVTENKTHGQTSSLTTQQLPHLTLPPPETHNHDPLIEEPTTPEPIVEVPATPEAEKIQEFDIEDFGENCEEIPTIRLNMEEFNQNIQTFIENNMELTEGDMSRALVAVSSEAASIPTPKLKNVSQLRTEHQVYELPDSHPLLQGLEKREPDDPCLYLLAIWTPGETSESIQPPKGHCTSQESGALCHRETCFLCNSIREANSQTVRGTLLIPCRTAMRGSFPLNGTYFQVNEVFADHDSSLNPIDVPRSWLWNLPRRTVYFGTSIPTIFRGFTTEAIQYCFWRGFVCVRGFDQKTRAPRPLMARLHFPASKLKRSRGNWTADED